MKFTNGYWMIRDGVNALYAREAYELNVGEDKESLNVLAPTSVVHGRYDTLNLPTFNIDVTAPAEGVIRVVAGHWQGATDYPGFPLNADDAGDRDYVRTAAEGDGDGEVGQDGASISLTSGGLTAKVVKGSPWNLTFLGRDGKELTQSSGKSLGRFTLNGLSNVTAQPVGEFGVTMDGSAYDESDVFTAIQLRLGVGENVYGFGERFGAYVKNGQTIDIWNEDGGTASEQGYKDIPFYMTSNGYGVLVNNRGHVSFEVGSGKYRGRTVLGTGGDHRLLCDLRSDAEADSRPLHRTGRTPRQCSRMELWPVVDHLVHHQVRREDHQLLHRWHGRARHSAERLPL